ncbi:hypothetical protein QQP08_004340, partial [Theobroma cacao]
MERACNVALIGNDYSPIGATIPLSSEFKNRSNYLFQAFSQFPLGIGFFLLDFQSSLTVIYP